MSVLRTPFCRVLGIDYPICSVGMGLVAGPELAAAVSNAGGFGVLGTHELAPDAIRSRIAQTRALTGRPFGVNVIIASDGSAADLALLLDAVSAISGERPAALVLFWGDPGPYVAAAHAHGVRVFVQVGSVAEAEAVAAAGVDVVIAQGVEAGGHVRGTTSIWQLLPDVVAAVDPVPVLASGGIGDGVGIARALRLGAQGVSMGTRFVASQEAFVHPAHKQRIVASTAADTVYSELYDAWWPDAPHRTLRNKSFQEWEAAGRPPSGERPGEGTVIGTRPLPSGQVQPWPRYAVGAIPPGFEGDLDSVPMLAGESRDVINDIQPAAAIVRQLARDTEAALA
jgi:NAD(P)H-dependent flavin oxidoreductase YrpB (nitropropane dioxygenase family)